MTPSLALCRKLPLPLCSRSCNERNPFINSFETSARGEVRVNAASLLWASLERGSRGAAPGRRQRAQLPSRSAVRTVNLRPRLRNCRAELDWRDGEWNRGRLENETAVYIHFLFVCATDPASGRSKVSLAKTKRKREIMNMKERGHRLYIMSKGMSFYFADDLFLLCFSN